MSRLSTGFMAPLLQPVLLGAKQSWGQMTAWGRLVPDHAKRGLAHGSLWAGRGTRSLVQGLRGLWHLTLALFPIPSESKWHGLVEVMALLLQTLVKGREDLAADSLDRTMEEMGHRWTARRLEWQRTMPPLSAEVRSTLTLAFKTLDMPTTFAVSGTVLKTVTTRCPFLEEARNEGTAQQVCQAVCSEGHSLFRGIASGFPFHVSYQAPAMMGYDAPACVKVFHLVRVPQRGASPLPSASSKEE